MRKISAGVTSCGVALFCALTSVSAVKKNLNSINDLKKINYGQSVPKHSLVLLYWFANIVDIDENNVIWLTFDPNSGDYGSHHYGNYEGLLDPLPWGNRYRYYTIGNLYYETSMPLPPYVLRPPTGFVGRNRDRIIILVREQNIVGQAFQIDQVYITQHIQNQGTYDPDHTYRITTNLLRQIREFSVGDDQQQMQYLRSLYGSNADDIHIRNTWGDLACLGMLLFIVIQERYSFYQHNNRTENNHTPENNNNNNRPDNCRPENSRPEKCRPENCRPEKCRPENRQNDWNDDALVIGIITFIWFILFTYFWIF
ncbi:uncharacterized protein LOC117957920 [Etheostoma cragini]|uniref:uncharacterized protein LOC117957920 n=1 Tax=Etheostoma cragini TaxID=417921 RepID=UPI00155E6180|nr:uncharacterized protein LOC117957920 [Etheostoma cragini]XP_034749899.1 uncharacterized protein LOC117957920 [Etheostoma cragini]